MTAGSQQQSPPFLKVAIVGGGAAGLSTALHLAPLVSRGLIQCPIHLFEGTTECSLEEGEAGIDEIAPEAEAMGLHCSRGSGAFGRDIGVGIWSTALLPFSTNRPSHRALLERLERNGTWIGDVGYRIPDGSWLTRSSLPPSPFRHVVEGVHGDDDNLSNPDDVPRSLGVGKEGNPSLLFVQENELLSALREAVSMEEQIVVWGEHSAKPLLKSYYGKKVDSIVCDDGDSHDDDDDVEGTSMMEVENLTEYLSDESHLGHDRRGGRLVFSDGTTSSRKYHFIVAAGGMHSQLRLRYSRHLDHHVYQAKFFKSRPNEAKIDLPLPQGRGGRGGGGGGGEAEEEEVLTERDFERRGYTVFRGNAPMAREEGGETTKDRDQPFSFQTWGKGHSMRFATVPVPLLSHVGSKSAVSDQPSIPGQVWFVTTDDKDITSLEDPRRRKELLLEKLADWHEPVCNLIRATPAEEILMERAVAHRHSAADLGSDFERRYTRDDIGEYNFHHSSRDEPLLCFAGDADMTVDPVLAQGFTIAMEDGAELARCVERAFSDPPSSGGGLGERGGGGDTTSSSEGGTWRKKQLDALRGELIQRHLEKEDRLICLLRATELVQAMAQPQSHTITGVLAGAIRPIIQHVVPMFVKKPIFDWMMRYSLGMHRRER